VIRIKVRLLRSTLALIIGIGCLFVSDRFSLPDSGSFVTQANAIRGRPLTPMSYAGVARRTTRRAVYGGAAYGAAAGVAYGAAVAGPGCVQVADAYGRLVMRCY
jgi:hypothetical protein